MPDQEHESVVALDTLTTYNCTENQRDWSEPGQGEKGLWGLCEGERNSEFIL